MRGHIMKRSAIVLFGGMTSLGLFASSYTAANAFASTPATVPTGSIIGSIASNGATGSALIALATVTPDQAQAAAAAAVPGTTAGVSEVIHDQGFVVYRVMVTDADGNNTEVIVDGGDGTVLDQYAPILWDGTNPATGAGTTAVLAESTGTTAAATVPTGSFTGSILSNGATGSALIALATQTPAQAQAAAVAAVPGTTAGAAEVIHDQGFVVYRVMVTDANGNNTEVIVDAGTAAVLDQYAPISWDGTVPGSSAAPTSAGGSVAASVPTGSFTGSILSNGATGAALIALATVTPDQAQAAAVAAVPGTTAGMAEVIHDQGFVVYRVMVTDASGNNTEVIVDAGDGTVLDQYAPILWDGVTP
jgi:uncharacterized membrane protein YkoI